ncbi:MAG: SpoIIE family protein phosphatase [Eubacteriales bacterium]|nr:SpoIIE family protein phosphatase [Eubacteriales bacterium]
METKKTISQRFNVRLAIIVAVAMLVSTLLIVFISTNINTNNYTEIITSTLNDIDKDIADTSDISMLAETQRIKIKVKKLLTTRALTDVEGFNEALRQIAEDQNLSEISVANRDNIIVFSSIDEYIDFDMNSNEGSKVFGELNNGVTEIVQPVRKNAYQGEGVYDEYNKYAGVPLEGIGYLQIGISAQTFQEQIDEKVKYIAENRHIGQTGTVIVANTTGDIISHAGKDGVDFENTTLSSIGLDFDMEKSQGQSFVGSINGVHHLIGVKFVEGYYIIGAVPIREVQSVRNRMTITNAATEIVIFLIMFLFIRKMIHTIIVSKIHNVNNSLREIIKGQLETKVSEYSTREFSHLSDAINSTVTSLKDYMDREQKKIKEELEFAKNIQLSALPKLSTIDRYSQLFDLYATMNTAKEVGGDFYDFYMLDDSHLAVLIADVSGKGIPAALFMMTSKTMLKNYVYSGMKLNEAFTRANEELCESNDAGMFVTVWMGILDLKTGNLEYVNAGHNPPLIYNENGEFEYLKCRPGFVLTGMPGLKYKAQKASLRPGDKLFLYTDGVTEATDPDQQLFGEDRLLSYMNGVKDQPLEAILHGLKADIDLFAREAEQFDDITMVGLRYNGWIN